MIFLIVGERKNERTKQIKSILDKFSNSEVIVFDDTTCEVNELEQYIYPSLFSLSSPIIHLKYILDNNVKHIPDVLLKKLMTSPTLFIFEEFKLNKSIITIFKKIGSSVYEAEDVSGNKKEDNIFVLVEKIISSDKKNRWLAFQELLKGRPIESLMGPLLWKVRQMYEKNNKDKEKYKLLYTNLISAQAYAWERNFSLELAIEKVLLS